MPMNRLNSTPFHVADSLYRWKIHLFINKMYLWSGNLLFINYSIANKSKPNETNSMGIGYIDFYINCATDSNESVRVCVCANPIYFVTPKPHSAYNLNLNIFSSHFFSFLCVFFSFIRCFWCSFWMWSVFIFWNIHFDKNTHAHTHTQTHTLE